MTFVICQTAFGVGQMTFGVGQMRRLQSRWEMGFMLEDKCSRFALSADRMSALQHGRGRSRLWLRHDSLSNISLAICNSCMRSLLTVRYFELRDLSFEMMMSATATWVNHLWSAGMMYHGAHLVLV